MIQYAQWKLKHMKMFMIKVRKKIRQEKKTGGLYENRNR